MNLSTKASAKWHSFNRINYFEVPSGFEPLYEVLQTSA